jgi:hypothetical protein
MRRMWLAAPAAMLALALSPQALAQTDKGVPEEYTGERGLVLSTAIPVPKAEVAQTARTQAEIDAIGGSNACWQVHASYERGSLVYRRAVHQQTVWCSNWSVITYHSTETWPSTGSLCSVMWGPASWRSAGGVGAWHVDITSRGGFSCWVNWFDYRDWIQFTIRFTYYGSAWGV